MNISDVNHQCFIEMIQYPDNINILYFARIRQILAIEYCKMQIEDSIKMDANIINY